MYLGKCAGRGGDEELHYSNSHKLLLFMMRMYGLCLVLTLAVVFLIIYFRGLAFTFVWLIMKVNRATDNNSIIVHEEYI